MLRRHTSLLIVPDRSPGKACLTALIEFGHDQAYAHGLTRNRAAATCPTTTATGRSAPIIDFARLSQSFVK
jgi:hypothetical protein